MSGKPSEGSVPRRASSTLPVEADQDSVLDDHDPEFAASPLDRRLELLERRAMNVRQGIAYLIILIFVALLIGVPLYRRHARRRRKHDPDRGRIDIIRRDPEDRPS
jgi:hypothetical protein